MTSMSRADSLDRGAEQRVLVVCSANICRSPSVAFLLERALRDRQPGVTWRVESAGTAVAAPEQPMCRSAAREIARDPGGTAFADSHGSRPLSMASVERAGLILVASSAERSAVATLSPAARRRLFTVREAALLAARLGVRAGSEPALLSTGSEILSTFVDLLDDQRGTLAISAGPAHFTRRRSGRRSTLDLGDVHQGQERRHKPVLGAARSAVATLSDEIGKLVLVAAPSAADSGRAVGDAEDVRTV